MGFYKKTKGKKGIADDLGDIAIAGAGLGIAGGIAGAAGAPGGVSQAIGDTAGFLPAFAGVSVLKRMRLKDPTRKLYGKKKRRMY